MYNFQNRVIGILSISSLLSPAFHDMQNAMLQYSMYMTSQGMTRETAKKLKPSQFQLIREEKLFKTKEEMEELARKKEEERKAAMLNMFDPSLLEKLRSAQTG
ncbi:hypothetical protein [Escherichia coli]|uniref:hypothetical protein n=1 Tax=Escherichia coli TaxID=562 RepID=UPI003B9A2A4D